ncbi:MAG: hypothetical protein QOI35_2514 [Cryptosporangiaceae bacterium]|nr:hypothetical protein [Cryptosporangiaceae bacterium]
MTKGVIVSDTENAAREQDEAPLPDGIPLPDAAPATMPAEARTGPNAATDVEHADPVRADGELLAGGVPPGTAPRVPAAPGTAEEAAPARDVHTPDDGPGGRDIDTAEPPLASRPRAARQP